MKKIIYVDGSCIPGSNLVSYAAVSNKSKKRVLIGVQRVSWNQGVIRRLAMVAELHAIWFGYKRFGRGVKVVVCSDCKRLVDNLNQGKKIGLMGVERDKARKLIRVIASGRLQVLWKRGHRKNENPFNHIVDRACHKALAKYKS